MKVVDVPAQMVLFPLILTDGVTLGVTVMVMVFEVAVTGLAQAALDVKVQVTVCPLVKVEEV